MSVHYRLPDPPDATTVVGKAVGLVIAGAADEADRLMEAAVHLGCRPIALLDAALKRGAADEAERRDRADALRAKQLRLEDVQ